MKPEDFLKMPAVHYDDWFGAGDSHSDYLEAVGDGPPPDEVLTCGNMILLLWPERVLCVGYDGNEYWHSFEFDRA